MEEKIKFKTNIPDGYFEKSPITLGRLKNAVADIKADDEWVNDSHTHAEYKGVCEGLDMLIRHFEEVKDAQTS